MSSTSRCHAFVLFATKQDGYKRVENYKDKENKQCTHTRTLPSRGTREWKSAAPRGRRRRASNKTEKRRRKKKKKKKKEKKKKRRKKPHKQHIRFRAEELANGRAQHRAAVAVA